MPGEFLPPWLIDKLNREDKEKEQHDDRPQPTVEDDDRPPKSEEEEDKDDKDRGVEIIQIT